MKAKLPLLQSLKLAQLRHVAVQCGIGSSGTKAALTARVEDELGLLKTQVLRGAGGAGVAARAEGGDNGTQRILSIDMGIRNLAFCVFDVPPRIASSSGHGGAQKLLIRSWKHVAVSRKPEPSARLSTATSSKIKESFEPAVFASYAYNFLAEVIYQHSPTTVLIERQRYRSMGSSAVQEWTVRVNMFEGMLYAVLRTLVAEQKWSGAVQALSPQKVGSFWIVGGDDDTSARKAKTAKARNKAAKVDLVGKWLDTKHVLDFPTAEAKRTAAAFLTKWKATGKRTPKRIALANSHDEDEPEEAFGKLDDLADCLLQGVAWTRWQENKMRLLRDGIEGIDMPY